MVSSLQLEPVSRTDQYKRVMKPLLERKRRARINRCLDELRDLLVAALQSEGETVTRLEKADILEMTVRHVRRLDQRRRLTLPPPGVSPDHRHDAVKFQQGFLAAAQQVQSFLMSTPSLEPTSSSRLMVHLSSCASSIVGPSNPTSTPTSQQPQVHQSSPAPSGVQDRVHPALLRHSPPLSPPALVDLSSKVSSTPMPKLVAPTPIRKEPIYLLKEDVGPQDLSMRRERDEQLRQENSDAWRPW